MNRYANTMIGGYGMNKARRDGRNPYGSRGGYVDSRRDYNDYNRDYRGDYNDYRRDYNDYNDYRGGSDYDYRSDYDYAERITLIDGVKNLPEKERTVIEMRYYQGSTQTEIAKVLDVSQAQVSRLEKGAIERLRTSFQL